MSAELSETAAGSTRSGRRASARPIRDPDPVRNAAYWARIERIVDEAPPLTDEQRAAIRLAFHRPAAPTREAA